MYCSSSTTTAEGVERHLRTSLEYHKCFYTMHLNCVSIVKSDKRTITLTAKEFDISINVMIVDLDIFFAHFLYITFGSNFLHGKQNPTLVYVHGQCPYNTSIHAANSSAMGEIKSVQKK